MARNQAEGGRRGRGFLASRVFLAGAGAAFLALVALAGFFAFRGDDAPKRRVRTEPVVSTEMQVDVIVDHLDYTPRDLTVTKGATVTWRFEDTLPHNVVDDRGAFDSGILQRGESWSFTADSAGTYYYYCTLHHVMQGTLAIVE